MKEDNETVELSSLVKGKVAPKTSTKSTPFWEKVVCFITGDVTIEEMTETLNRHNEIHDYHKAQEIPPNIKKASK